MRYLGVDYGEKATGLALSDESGTLAFPFKVFTSPGRLTEEIVHTVKEKGVEAIVIGRSVDEGGTYNRIAKQTRTLDRQLKNELDVPIYWQDEQFTTREAKRYQDKPGRADAAAAALILQRFLDKENDK